jgi:hypothetical protein
VDARKADQQELVIRASFGPFGRSETDVRAFYLATVFGSIPKRLAHDLKLS